MRETLMDPQSSVNRRMQKFKETAFAQPSNVSLETDGETGYTGNRGEDDVTLRYPRNDGRIYSADEKPATDDRRAESQNGRTREEVQSTFARRTEEAARDGRRLKKRRNGSLLAYTPSRNLEAPASRAVEFLRQQGCEAVLTAGAVETNRNGVTTVHNEAMTDRTDGVVYVCDIATLPAADIAAHEIVHVHEIRGTESYVAYEGVLLDNLLWLSKAYQEFTSWINEEYYNGEQQTDDLVLTEKANRELVAYVNAAVALRPDYATEQFSAMFADWNAVVEASRTFNAAIGADYSSIMDNSLPSSDGTGRDSYTQNAEIESRIRSVERDFQENVSTPYMIAKAMMEKGNPQQLAVGVDSRAQNAGALRDSGVEIGVRPAAMDEVFKRMSAKSRKKLYAELEAHTGVKLVEDPTLLADGEYDPATQTIRINPNRATPMTVIKHELTHYLESSKILYQDFMNYAMEQSTAFNDWLASKGKTLDEMKAEIVKRYAASGVTLSTERGASAEQEVLANFAAEVLFTDLTALRELGQKNRTLFQRLKHFVLGIVNKFRGTPAETDLQHLERMFAAALEKTASDSVSEVSDTIKFSLMNRKSFAENVEEILSMNDADALRNQQEGNFIRVLDNTPAIVLENVADAQDLPVIIRFDALYLAARENGSIKGHYHNLGRQIMGNLPNYISNPDAIVRMNNGRINLFSRVSSAKGNTGIISVELNSVKDINNSYNKYNVVVTVFSAADNYVKNNLRKNGVSVEYKKEGLSQVNPQLYEWLAIVNDKPFDTIVAKKPPGVNTYSTQDSTKKFIAPEAVAEMPGDQLTDEELLAQLRKRGMSSTPNPLQTAQLRPNDVVAPASAEASLATGGETGYTDNGGEADVTSSYSRNDEEVLRVDAQSVRADRGRKSEDGRSFEEVHGTFARRTEETARDGRRLKKRETGYTGIEVKMMSHYVTPEMMEEFTRRMKNPRPMTEEQKAKMAEVEKKIKALSPEERRVWLHSGDDD